jgi:hypothetical protein
MHATPGFFSFYLRLSLDMSFAFVFLVLLRLSFGREMRGIEYTLTDQAVCKKGPSLCQTVPYDQIRRFRYVNLPFLGRFLSVRYAHGRIRIPFRAAGVTDLVDTLADRAARQGDFDPDNHEAIRRFKKAVSFWQETDRRLRRIAAAFPAVILCTVAVSVLSSFFIWDLPLYAVFVWSLFGLFMNCLWVAATEWILYFSGQKGNGLLYGRTAVAFLLVYLMCGILFNGYYY